MQISRINNYLPAFQGISVQHRDRWSDSMLDAVMHSKYVYEQSKKGDVVLDFEHDMRYEDDPKNVDACNFRHTAAIKIKTIRGTTCLSAECLVGYLEENPIGRMLYKKLKELDESVTSMPKPKNNTYTNTYKPSGTNRKKTVTPPAAPKSKEKAKPKFVPGGKKHTLLVVKKTPYKIEKTQKKKSFWKWLFGG